MRATMTYQDFLDCIKKYRNLLLEIIPDFYKEEDINNFTFESPDERKSYFTRLKSSTDSGYYIKEHPGHFLTDEAFSALREPYIKQQQKWIKKCSGFVKEMKDVLPYIDHPNLRLFRFRFFDRDKYLEDALNDKAPLSIFICFMSYLVRLRQERKDVSTSETIIRNKMIDQEDEYILKYEDRIKKSLGGKAKKKRKCRIPDKKFKQLCKDVEKKIGARRSLSEITFFKKLSEMSKLPKYDKTGRGYKTWESVKKRYYEVFPSKKTNH